MNEITALVFKEQMTEQGLKDLRNKYPSDLVQDMTDDDSFKAARKTRTERNKLVEAIGRRRIDITNDIKSEGDSIIDQVNDIYSVVVDPFETEDKRRKEVAAEKARIEKEAIEKDRKRIAELNDWIINCQNGSSDHISSAIDAITNIDCSDFHKEVIHEAIETKEKVLDSLGQLLTNKIAFEASERQRKEAEAAQAKIERERAIDANINDIRMIPSAMFGSTAEVIQYRIAELQAYPLGEEHFGDRLDEANAANDQAINQLELMLSQQRLVEKSQREAEEAQAKAEEERQQAEATARAQAGGKAAAEAALNQPQIGGSPIPVVKSVSMATPQEVEQAAQAEETIELTILVTESKRNAVISLLIDQMAVEVRSETCVVIK